MEHAPQHKPNKQSASEKANSLIRAALAAAMIHGAPVPEAKASVPAAPYGTLDLQKAETLPRRLALNIIEAKDPSHGYEELWAARPGLTEAQWRKTESLLEQSGRVLEIALEAKNSEPQDNTFARDPALRDVGKVKLALVKPLLLDPAVNKHFWEALKQKFTYQDIEGREDQEKPERVTAGIKLDLLRDLSVRYGGANPVELEEAAAYVTRNLYWRHEPVTNATVAAEVERIHLRRERDADLPLFNGNALLIANDELLDNGQPRFGTPALQFGIQDQLRQAAPQGSRLLYVASEPLERVKHHALQTIEHSLGPLTVFFDGHGSSDGSKFILSSESSDQVAHDRVDGVVTISSADLASALVKRFVNQQTQNPTLDKSNISIVFSACVMQNYLRDVAEQLKESGIPLPRVMISASEFGQYGSSDFTNAFGSKFNQLIVTSPNLGTILKKENTTPLDSKPSIFVPDKGNDGREILMQLGGLAIPRGAVQAA